MSASALITGGFGSFGSVSLVITDGFALGAVFVLCTTQIKIGSIISTSVADGSSVVTNFEADICG